MTVSGGNWYNKHETRNPVLLRVVEGFYAAFDQLVAHSGARRIHEIGCGEGYLALRALEAGLIVTGEDVDAEVVAGANARAVAAGFGQPFAQRSIYDLSDGELSGFDLVVCCEVLEHLDDPSVALARLMKAGAPSLLVSVPREPLWCALNIVRLRYLLRIGNTPGHVNHWSRAGFLRFLGDGGAVVEAVRGPIPWTMALCRTGIPS